MEELSFEVYSVISEQHDRQASYLHTAMATLQAGPEAPAPLLSGQGEIITPDTAAPSKKGKWQRFVTKIWDS